MKLQLITITTIILITITMPTYPQPLITGPTVIAIIVLIDIINQKKIIKKLEEKKMTEKINWEQLSQECNKINKIVNQTDRLNSWKIEYGELVIYINSYYIEHTFFNELNKHFPQYILDIQSKDKNRIKIPLTQNNIRKEEK